MSDNNQDSSNPQATAPANKPEQNTTPVDNSKRITEIQNELTKIDSTDGAKAQMLLQEYGALHADPSGVAKNKDGKTAEQVFDEYQKVSAEIGKKKVALEEELVRLTKNRGAIADNETLRQLAKERAEASAKAVQEPPRDLTQFANPELDKVRSQLQSNPLSGGEKASVDDGTGGEGQAPKAEAPAKK